MREGATAGCDGGFRTDHRHRQPFRNTQLSVVRKDPHLIREISVPDWKAQLYAVGQDPELIRFISEPAEKYSCLSLTGTPP